MHVKREYLIFFLINPEGAIVVSRKLKVKYKKNEFKKEGDQENKRSSKNGNGKQW